MAGSKEKRVGKKLMKSMPVAKKTVIKVVGTGKC